MATTKKPQDLEAGKPVPADKKTKAKKAPGAKLSGAMLGGLFLAFVLATCGMSFYTKNVSDSLETTTSVNGKEVVTERDPTDEELAGLILGWMAVATCLILFLMAVLGKCNPACPNGADSNSAKAAGAGAAAGAAAGALGMSQVDKDRLRALEDQNKALGRDLQSLQDSNADLQGKLADAQAAAVKSDDADSLKDKQAEIDALKTGMEVKEAEVKAAQERAEKAEKAADEAKAEAEKAAATAVAASNAAVAASKDDAKDDAKIADLEKTVVEKDAVIAEKTETIAARDAEIDTLKRDRHVLKDKVTELNTGLQKVRVEKESAENALAEHASASMDDDKKAEKKKWAEETFAGLKKYVGVEVTDGDPSREGMRVSDLRVGGPADDSGIVDEDYIITASGTKVDTVDQFKAQLKGLAPGDKIPLELSRDGKDLSLVLQLGAKKDGEMMAMGDLRRLLRIKEGRVVPDDLEWTI